MALCLAAGLDGIKKGMTPPEAVDYNVYNLTKEELARVDIDCLPATLEEAIKESEKDPFIKETLGDHAYNAYISGKKNEWLEYQLHVSQWEVDRYLKK